LVFQDIELTTIACFNVKTTQLKRQIVNLDKREFLNFCGMSDRFDFKEALEDSYEYYSQRDFHLYLEEINENFIFLRGNLNFSIIFIMNRHDSNSLFHYFVCDSNFCRMSVYNSNLFIDCAPLNSVKCKIHETSTSKNEESVFEKKQLGLYDFYSTAGHKYIFIKDLFEYEEEFANKEIAKFRVY
jgi:hypothetical protein